MNVNCILINFLKANHCNFLFEFEDGNMGESKGFGINE